MQSKVIKNGKYSVTETGQWASQFLLKTSDAKKIHKFLQTQYFYSEDDACKKLATLISESVRENDNSRYRAQQYELFILSLVEGFDIDEAAENARMRQGDAEGCRRTAAWIAEAVNAYVGKNIPKIAEMAEGISEALTVDKRREIGPGVRSYAKEKPSSYPGIQKTICSVINQLGICTYDAIHNIITDKYGESVDRTTTIWNILDLRAKDEVITLSRGKGIGRPVIHVCKKGMNVPEHMRKTCGSCVFYISCDDDEKERDNQRFICELRRECNKRVEKNIVSTYVTSNMGACKYHNSSQERKRRSFRKFERTDTGKPICQICKSDAVKEPTAYDHYTICSNCNSQYYYLCDGRFSVQPGVRDLLQQALEEIYGKSVKPVKRCAKLEGSLDRQYVELTIKKGDAAHIDQNKLIYIPKEEKTRSYLLDAIECVRVLDGAYITPYVYEKLDDRILSGKNVNRPPNASFEGYINIPDVHNQLKERIQEIREQEVGLALARILIMGKKMNNAILTLQAGEEGLLCPVDASRLFFKQMNVVAHTIMYWTGNRENLLSFEAVGERYAWKAIKRALKDTSMRFENRTQERYIFSVPYIGKVRARSPFSAGLNAIYRRVLEICREVLCEKGFSWFPGELVLHYRRRKDQQIPIGTALDFRELFLALFRFTYMKACKKDQIRNTDFVLSSTSREEKVYTLTYEAEDKVRDLIESVMNKEVYYLGKQMSLWKAMKECARSLRNFLLEGSKFIPFVCALNEEQFKKILKTFQNIERFCGPSGKGPPVSMFDILS